MSEVRKRKQKQKKNAAELPVLNPAAAGIDIGATEIYVAVPHKLARIIFHLLTTRQAYDESVFAKLEQQTRLRMEAKLRKQAQALGLQLVPANANIA